MAQNFKNHDSYIAGFPQDSQSQLELIRKIIASAAPSAVEVISYYIPTFKIHENLVHYAGFKNHIGFYPGTKVMEEFSDELVNFKRAKGSVQFPLNKQIPITLIAKMVAYSVTEDQKKLDSKKQKKPEQISAQANILKLLK